MRRLQKQREEHNRVRELLRSVPMAKVNCRCVTRGALP